MPGKRYRSLISGENLTDVVVTGEHILTNDIVIFDFLEPFFNFVALLRFSFLH